MVAPGSSRRILAGMPLVAWDDGGDCTVIGDNLPTLVDNFCLFTVFSWNIRGLTGAKFSEGERFYRHLYGKETLASLGVDGCTGGADLIGLTEHKRGGDVLHPAFAPVRRMRMSGKQRQVRPPFGVRMRKRRARIGGKKARGLGEWRVFRGGRGGGIIPAIPSFRGKSRDVFCGWAPHGDGRSAYSTLVGGRGQTVEGRRPGDAGPAFEAPVGCGHQRGGRRRYIGLGLLSYACTRGRNLQKMNCRREVPRSNHGVCACIYP